MKLPDLRELALRNLRESLLRNSLTTIGISVGVASLVAMLSLGHRASAAGVAAADEVGIVRHGGGDVAAGLAKFQP